MVLQRIVKPKTQKGKRFLESREPKIIERNKQAMFIKGGNTSNTITQVLKELYMIKRQESVMYKRKNIMRPFEDETPLEFFAKKSDSALFMFGCHSKKRPDNLILGRLFDYHVLDMFELGVEKFTSMHDIEGNKCSLGNKPCILFAGDLFDEDKDYIRLKNLFTDFFRGPVITQVRMTGLDHVVMITAKDSRIFLRNYRIEMKKSGCKTPRIELEEMGPSLDLSVRRTKLASDDLFKRALKQPKTAKPRKKKNVSHDPFGSKLGRIHMQKQDLGKLQTRKVKALKQPKGGKKKEKIQNSNEITQASRPGKPQKGQTQKRKPKSARSKVAKEATKDFIPI